MLTNYKRVMKCDLLFFNGKTKILPTTKSSTVCFRAQIICTDLTELVLQNCVMFGVIVTNSIPDSGPAGVWHAVSIRYTVPVIWMSCSNRNTH